MRYLVVERGQWRIRKLVYVCVISLCMQNCNRLRSEYRPLVLHLVECCLYYIFFILYLTQMGLYIEECLFMNSFKILSLFYGNLSFSQYTSSHTLTLLYLIYKCIWWAIYSISLQWSWWSNLELLTYYSNPSPLDQT
jgi:hypothetical protein